MNDALPLDWLRTAVGKKVRVVLRRPMVDALTRLSPDDGATLPLWAIEGELVASDGWATMVLRGVHEVFHAVDAADIRVSTAAVAAARMIRADCVSAVLLA